MTLRPFTRCLAILLAFIMIFTSLNTLSVNAQDLSSKGGQTESDQIKESRDGSSSEDPVADVYTEPLTKETYDLDEEGFLTEEIIIPDEIEEEERSPEALNRAPVRFKALNSGEPVDALEIRTFVIQFFYGATKQPNGDYVWTAPSSSPGHRFSFRINYAISGQFDLDPGSIEMRIPIQILRDRTGAYAGTYEMSIPTRQEVEDGEEVDMDINYAYYEDGDDIVIYNFRTVYTGENGYIELSYFTDRSTYNYIDYGADNDKSDDFYATIKVTGNDKTVEAESEHIPVFINTNAVIQSTDKRFPTKYSSWDPKWGTAPDDADEYYWLLWEVRSVIDPGTQPYNFTFEDTELSVFPADPHNESESEIYAVRGSGQTYFTPGTDFYMTDQTVSGYRYDYVLTRHKKSWWDRFEHVEVTNKVRAEVDPVDQVDPDTEAKSQRTFVWNRPQFIHPNGWYDSFKRADRSYNSSHGLDYLGMIAGKYSRYDMENLQEGKVDSLGNLDYAVWFEGYPYLHTVPAGADFNDPANYWKVPVRYELVDWIFYPYDEAKGVVEPNVGTDDETYGIPIKDYIDNRMTYEDFQIDYLSYGTKNYQDAVFDQDSQSFKGTSVTFNDDDVLDFYVYYQDEQKWEWAASVNLKTKERNFNDRYVVTMTDNRIYFKDDIVGYKVETYSSHYHTRVDLVPNIRIKNSKRMMSLIKPRDPVTPGEYTFIDALGILNSETTNFYPYDPVNDNYETKFLSRSESASDYLRRSTRNSYISKRITATSNVTRRKRYNINWEVKMDELYTLGEGSTEYINQQSGTFYDLLPSGSVLIQDSVAVATEKGFLPDNDFSFEVIDNYNDTGRSLLVVRISEPGDYYNLYYQTAHPWDSIKDWGGDIYNPVAYETGNMDISPFNSDKNRGPERAKREMETAVGDIDPEKLIYSQYSYDISILTAAAANLHKKVKDSTDEDYSYDTWTTIDGDYSYRWRFQNTFTTKAKDLIFFDSLENYPVQQDDLTYKESDWRGTFRSIDVTQLKKKGIEPVVYLSEVEGLNLEENHDLSDTSVWTKMEDFGDVSKAKAIAVDARKTPDGSDFILDAGDSVSVIVYMKAPPYVEFEGEGYPESYNNIYLDNTTIAETGGEAHFFIHQDYTTIRLAVVGDVSLHKVNEENKNEPIRNIKFRLYGTSDYGTEIDEIKSTDRNGDITFKDVEKGSYILQEHETTPDWLEDHTEHTVVIDAQGRTFIDGELYEEGEAVLIENTPRIHGKISFRKLREEKNQDKVDFVKELIASDIGDTVRYNGMDYTITEKDGEKATLEVAFPAIEFYYPELEDNGNDIAGGTVTNSYGDLDWRITSGGELIIGKEGETQNLIMERSLSTHPWGSYLNQIKAVRFEGNVKAGEGEGLRFLFLDGDYYSYYSNGSIMSVDFTNLDTSKVTSLYGLFANLEMLKYINWGDTFDTSSVTDMSYMFEDTTSLQYVDLSSFDTKSLQYCSGLFYTSIYPGDSINEKPSLKGVNLTGWDTSQIKEISYMFYSNQERTDLTVILVDDRWNVEHITEDYYNGYYSFFNCVNLPNYVSGEYGADKAHSNEGGYLTLNKLIVPLEIPPIWPIGDTTFLLSGTSDYGTEYNVMETTDENGFLKFDDIEKGIYELREIKENEKYVINTTVWTVRIDDSRNGFIIEPSDESKRDRLYELGELEGDTIIYNERRYWDFAIRKVDSDNQDIWLSGAVFNLSGISDLGNEFDITVESDENGRAHFSDVERGTYVLKELQAPKNVDSQGKPGGNRNYLDDDRQYIVVIDENGNAEIEGFSKNVLGDIIFTNDRAYEGKITVTKKWDDGLTGAQAESRPAPKLHLMTKDPDTLERYYLFYDANGGHFSDGTHKNYILFSNNDVILEGTERIPVYGKRPFKGWYLDREATIPYVPSEENRDITVYAGWGPPPRTVRYAVSVYDIGRDVNKEGKTMGLTFGPALGKNYARTYDAHTVDGDNIITGDDAGTTSKGNAFRCVHFDDWETIVSWNNEDPYVYEKCVKNCCTHGVDLTFPDPLLNMNYNYAGGPDGDGVSMMDYEFNSYADNWGSSARPAFEGGWGPSRVRAMFNGVDDDITDDGIVTELVKMSYPQLETSTFTGNNTLLAAFPKVISEAIGLRKTDARTGSSWNGSYYWTTYDKLWLLTYTNIGGAYGSYYHDGSRYARFILNDIKISGVQGTSGFVPEYRLAPYGATTYEGGRIQGRMFAILYFGGGSMDFVHSHGMSYTTENQYADGWSPGFAFDTPYFDNNPVESLTNANRVTERPSFTELLSGLNQEKPLNEGEEPIDPVTEPDIVSGTVDGMDWRITAKGELLLGHESIKQTLNRTYYNSGYFPWDYYSSSIKSVRFVGHVDTCENAYLNEMFRYMSVEQLDLRGFDTSNVSSMYGFLRYSTIGELIGFNELDLSNVRDLRYAFYSTNVSSVDMTGLDLGNCYNLEHMFDNCKATEILGLDTVDFVNGSYADYMFYNSSVEEIMIPRFNPYSAYYMFAYSRAKIIDISGMNRRLQSGNINYLLQASEVEVLVLNPHIQGNYSSFSSAWYSGSGYNAEWIHVLNPSGTNTGDMKEYRGSELITFSSTTNPAVGGTWIRNDSLYLNDYYDPANMNVEYISEEGVNADNHWVKLDDNTWRYTFDVFDDTYEYYLYEEFLAGYESEAMAPNHITVNRDVVNKVATISNYRPHNEGDLEIRKTVSGIETDQRFEFTITLSGPSISGTQILSDVVFQDGVGKIMLSGGESKVIKGLPEGTSYTVAETAATNYLIGIGNDSGTVSSEEPSIVEFTNTYVPPVKEPGKVTIKKVVTGNGGYDAEYRIFIRFEGLDPDFEYKMSRGESFRSNAQGQADVMIDLKDQEELSFLELPYNATYQVTEAAGDYRASFNITDSGGNGTIVQSGGRNSAENKELSTGVETVDEGEDINITFTNEVLKYQKLKIKKLVTGEDNNGEFNFNIHIEGLAPNRRYDSSNGRFISDEDGIIDVDVTLSHNSELEFQQLDAGASFIITEEDRSRDGWNPEITSNNADTIGKNDVKGTITDGQDTEITFENVQKLTLSGTKTWIDEGVKHDNAEEVTLILKRSSENVPEEIVPEGEFDLQWEGDSYYYTNLTRLDPDGALYTYTVQEEPVEDYITVQDENSFTNTKEKGRFTVLKTVSGNAGDPEKAFEFTITLTDQDGQPVSGAYSGVVFNGDGVGKIYLKHGESKTIETFVKLNYVITEEPLDHTPDRDKAEGIVSADEEPEYVFDNFREIYGGLRVEKSLSGNDTDPEKEFDFTVTLNDPEINGLYGDMEFEEGIARFSLKGGDHVEARDLPYGTEYVLEEADYTEEGYVTTYDSKSKGTILTTEMINTVVTNTKDRELTAVSVVKVWDDENDKDGIRPDHIKVQLYMNGDPYRDAVELSEENGWTYEWKDLFSGEEYTVKEIQAPSGYEISTEEKGNTVFITNTHQPETETETEPPEEDESERPEKGTGYKVSDTGDPFKTGTAVSVMIIAAVFLILAIRRKKENWPLDK